MWVFENCCFCIDLKTGCFIIAYLQLVGEIIISTLMFLGIGAAQVLINSSDPDHRAAGATLMALCAVTLLFVAVLLAFTIVLLVGLHKNKSGHVKIFLIYSVIFMLFYIVMTIVEIAVTAPPAQNIVTSVFYILLDIYFLLVLRSYWVKMGSGNALYGNA
ncbi:unnamed protein product [Parnassius apollo]|uniref:(apollo) hypothetical protein n=1 Tax=Parnassius apollo TaxID=110799 RepID=A0A8S3Y2D8_PARAO|nr:unnamed protein product [Parnassius apollo]